MPIDAHLTIRGGARSYLMPILGNRAAVEPFPLKRHLLPCKKIRERSAPLDTKQTVDGFRRIVG